MRPRKTRSPSWWFLESAEIVHAHSCPFVPWKTTRNTDVLFCTLSSIYSSGTETPNGGNAPVSDTINPLALARQLYEVVHADPRVGEIMLVVIQHLSPCKHGPDFASVIWYGKAYHFTALQSKAVKLLWEAWEESPHLTLRQEYILEAIGSDGGRLMDLFRNSEAWGEMIVQGTIKGTFRLSDQPK